MNIPASEKSHDLEGNFSKSFVSNGIISLLQCSKCRVSVRVNTDKSVSIVIAYPELIWTGFYI